jgi:hypothetical protein
MEIIEAGEGSSRRCRLVWPSVKDSLDFPAFTVSVRVTVNEEVD